MTNKFNEEINDYCVRNKCFINWSIISRIERLHRLSTINSDNISTHRYNSRICSETVSDATNVSMATVVVAPSNATTNFTTVWIDLGHLIWHTQPVWTTKTCMITAPTENSATIMPPTVANNELAHFRINEFIL